MSAAGRGRPARRPFLAVDVGGALNVVGVLVAYLSLSTLVPAAVAIGYGESPWPFLLAGAIAGGLGGGIAFATRGDAPARNPRRLPRRLAHVARRRRAGGAAVPARRRAAARPAGRRVLRGDVRLQHDRREPAGRRRGAAARPPDVAPAHAVARRDRDHRARARRPPAAPRRRPSAARARDAGARDRDAERADPGHRPARLDPLHRADGHAVRDPARPRLERRRRGDDPVQRGRARPDDDPDRQASRPRRARSRTSPRRRSGSWSCS